MINFFKKLFTRKKHRPYDEEEIPDYPNLPYDHDLWKQADREEAQRKKEERQRKEERKLQKEVKMLQKKEQILKEEEEKRHTKLKMLQEYDRARKYKLTHQTGKEYYGGKRHKQYKRKTRKNKY
jgi:hypothetical protein